MTVDRLIQVAGNAIFGQVEIDWESLDYGPHLERLRARFANHLRQEAADLDDAAAAKRYLSLRMRGTKIAREGSQEGEEYLSSSQETGTWRNLVTSGETVLLVGDSGSGKTTSLLAMADALSQEAARRGDAPLPVYVSLNIFAGGNADDLKTLAAYASGLEPRVLDALWTEMHRPLWLLLDSADEAPAVHYPALATALAGLLNLPHAELHTVVIACRPGSAQATIEEALGSRLYGLTLLPLSDVEVSQMLELYGASQLRDMVDKNPSLKHAVQNPGQLAALARSLAGGGRFVPRNYAQIFQILLDYDLFEADQGDYNYPRVKRPILAYLAYTMLCRDQTYLRDDEALYDLIADRLKELERQYERRQRVMPPNPIAKNLINELIRSSVLTSTSGVESGISFSDQNYRDFYASVYLRDLGASPATLEAIRPVFDPQRWIAPMIFLAAIYPEAEALFDALYASQPQTAADSGSRSSRMRFTHRA